MAKNTRTYSSASWLLATKDGPLSHHGDKVDEDEEITPTIENRIVLTWLKLIHKDLPKLVKQKYATELRSRTLASIKPEISIALESLLDELQSDTKVLRSSTKFQPKTNSKHKQASSSGYKPPSRKSSDTRNRPSCPICKAKGMPDGHFISKCIYLPDRDRRYMNKTRLVQAIDDALCDSEEEDHHNDEDHASESNDDEDFGRPRVTCVNLDALPGQVKRVQVGISPWFNVFHNHQSLKITVDSGAQINMIRDSVARSLNAKICKSSQQAFQADGSTPIDVIGEVDISFTRDNLPFRLNALICRNIDDDIIGGIPFMKNNNIIIDAANDEIIFKNRSRFCYSGSPDTKGLVRRTQAHILRSGSDKRTVFPGEFIELDLPIDLHNEKHPIAVEPRPDHTNMEWPSPRFLLPVNGKVRIVNETQEALRIPKKHHLCQAMPSVRISKAIKLPIPEVSTQTTIAATKNRALYSQHISVNKSQLNSTISAQFDQLHAKYDDTFSPHFKGYNGKAGNIEGVVNMGPVLPPQRKGRVPQYSRNRLDELQVKCDELEAMGVLAKPENVPVVAEYLNPSFLVKKPSGAKRLVTAFSEVARYAKPQPSLMPNVDATLRQIACWKYIIATDLLKAYYQIPLSKDSIKFCGISTPFKGIRVYKRCAMGMPGSETALEELMSRVLGDLIQDGSVAKVADDLYIGANTPELLFVAWQRVLESLDNCGLKLSASKTEIAPSTTTILGWTWSNGTLTASTHRISTLSTCEQPSTVKSMRSFLGAYKFLSRVLPNISTILAPLEDSVAGRNSSDRISWCSELATSFKRAQTHLQKSETITMPTPSDQLWILTDGAQKIPGIGSTLFITHPSGKRSLAGFYSAKLHKRQLDWLPCEIEALAISASVSHFAPYVIQSRHRTTVLTDSKPCVDAFNKLCKGQFSLSARVTTYLSTVSRYKCEVCHVKGTDNAFADFQSRNAAVCDNQTCQVCQFVRRLEESVVRSVSVKDILDGSVRIPFTTRSAWRTAQEECPDIRQAKAQLRQGTYPSKKVTNRRDVKRYLQTCTISRDGLLTVKRSEKYAPTLECIVIPRALINGLALAIHLKFDHPAPHQLKQIMRRAFYAISMDQVIDDLSVNCSQCAALRTIPNHLMEQTTECPPYAIGMNFAADVLKRERQLIFVIREQVTSYTQAIIIPNERHEALRDALIQLMVVLKPANGPPSIVRVDPAPGFQALVDDYFLQEHNIVVEVGRHKNINKNPVAERAIQEFEEEISKLCPTGQVSTVNIALICDRMNCKIRHPGISSKEMVTKRDQFTNHQLSIDDIDIILQKHEQHTRNHDASAKSKSALPAKIPPSIDVGDLVYIASDLSKSKQRDRYIVVKVDGEFCSLRKFTNTQLRESAVRVKKSHCFHVPSAPLPSRNMSNENPVPNDDIDEPPDAPLYHHPNAFNEDLQAATLREHENMHTVEECLTAPTSNYAETENPQPTIPASPIPSEVEPTDSQIPANVIVNALAPSNQASPVETVVPRRSQRQSCRPKYLGAYEC